MSESAKRHKAEAPTKLAFAIFTVSTSRYQTMNRNEPVDDVSGNLMQSMLENAGHSVKLRKLISDDKQMIEKSMEHVLSSPSLDVAVFCGGTGISKSDITIETMKPFLEKILPGFGEVFRRLSFDAMGSAALLSRAIAGVAKGKALFCVPGSPDAVRLCFEKLILSEAGHVVRHARE